MGKRAERLDAIKYLISSQEISQQVDLLSELVKMGFDCTQATISRDFKTLNVAKASSTNGEYIYVLPNDVMYRRKTETIPEVSSATSSSQVGFKSLNFSGNIAVIRTRPGYASHMAYDLDNLDWPGILGTVAGDDTIILVLSENITHEIARQYLTNVIPIN